MARGKSGKTNQPTPPDPGVTLYPWLPADEEANRVGYYVPSPEQISQHTQEIRNNAGRRQKCDASYVNWMVHVPTRRAFDGGVHCRE